ncbi:MAG: phosphatase PAP2 family protein [Steroidobacteraceae bacterium]
MHQINTSKLWLWNSLPPLAILLLLGWIAWADADTQIAQLFFYDATTQKWLATDALWANEILHRGGRNVMRLIGVLAILAWLASYRFYTLTRHRQALGYLALCLALIPLVVGGLKQITNVDCPWDLEGFGGNRPFVHYFESRPSDLPKAACFPGAHSSSAFALFALAFLARRRSFGLAVGVAMAVTVIGGMFSFAQQARGAHFLSHDLWSMFLAWSLCGLISYLVFERGRPS